jgi:hypothetical protein
MGEESSAVTIVFDSSPTVSPNSPRLDSFGLKVLFAPGKKEADDVIEEMIRHHSAPKTLKVVSDDHRIQKAARKRQASPLSCNEFMDLLDFLRKKKKNTTLLEKPNLSKAKESDHWLKEFEDLEKDPDLKDFFQEF